MTQDEIRRLADITGLERRRALAEKALEQLEELKHGLAAATAIVRVAHARVIACRALTESMLNLRADERLPERLAPRAFALRVELAEVEAQLARLLVP